MDDSVGGFLIPKVAYKSVPSRGVSSVALRWIGSFLCKIGYGIAQAGINVSGKGYHQEEYYPYKDIMDAIKNLKIKRKEE